MRRRYSSRSRVVARGLRVDHSGMQTTVAHISMYICDFQAPNGAICLSSNFREFSCTQHGRLYCIQIIAAPVSLSPCGQI